jgi:RNA polymerase subunit RPABC4/transcription elongation factor Spt4
LKSKKECKKCGSLIDKKAHFCDKCGVEQWLSSPNLDIIKEN